MLLERPKKAAMTLVPRTGKIPARTSELAGMHPSRRPNIKDPNARQRIYARVKARHAGSVNAIKTKIRDIRRQLERVDNLPADVRVQNERSLAFYQKGLAVAEVEKRRHKMIKKYHMVRFFGMCYSWDILDSWLVVFYDGFAHSFEHRETEGHSHPQETPQAFSICIYV